MKKAIIFSVLSVGCVGAVTASAVFLPAVVAYNGYSAYNFDFVSALNGDTFNLKSNFMNAMNISIKSLILGTRQVNNGNYVLYIGSEGYANNRGFLYDQNDISDFQNNPSRPLEKSDFGNGLQYLNSQEFKQTEGAVTPVVITYIDTLTLSDFVAKENYENLISSYKKLTITNDLLDEDEKLTDEQLEENKKKYDWANGAPSFSFAPGESYKDWEGNKKYFRDSYQSGLKFKELYNFITANFSGLQDVSGSQGIVLGYRLGKFAPSQYTGSFGASRSTNHEKNIFLNKFTPAVTFDTAFAQWLKTVFINITITG